jgi:hypothetical protein
VASAWKRDFLLVDSGASCNVCPLTYKAELPLHEAQGSAPTLRSVAGALLKTHGTRLVSYKLGNKMKLEVRHFVADVMFPVLSAGDD